MNPIAAIVEPSVDVSRIAREVAAAHIALQDAERTVEGAEKRATSAKETAAQRRLDLGRLLCEARKAWPARGPKAKGWGEFLATVGIVDRTAREYMALAGYMEVSAPESDGAEIQNPTRREVAAATAARREPEPVALIEDDGAVDVDVEDEDDTEEVTEYGRGLETPKVPTPAVAPFKPRIVQPPPYARARASLEQVLAHMDGKNAVQISAIRIRQLVEEAIGFLAAMDAK